MLTGEAHAVNPVTSLYTFDKFDTITIIDYNYGEVLNMKIENRNKKTNPLYKKVYQLWYNMNKRCYNQGSPDYKYYGGIGITTSEDWKELDRFIEQIDKIKGFNEERFLNGELVLDKDTERMDNKIYSVETCEFISKTLSNRRKPSQQKKFNVYYENKRKGTFYNQSEVAEKFGIRQGTISWCLTNNKVYKGWHFKYV